MATATISFREIVKLIHPDRNPHIVDAGSKMSDASKFRNDESMLYRLGVHWGVITPETRDNRTNRNTQRTQRTQNQRTQRDEYTEFRRRNRIFQPGDTVFVRTKRAYVQVTKVTEKRVYFVFRGRESYAAKKNVRFGRF